MTESPVVDLGLDVPVFSLRDDLIAYLNKAIAFLTIIASSRVKEVQGRQGQSYFGTGNKINSTSSEGNNTEDLDTYDSDCDDVSNAKADLMANISNYGSDVISEKAQRIKPTLYDGDVISKKHAAMHVIDNEETLILEDVSRSKLAEKDKDPEAVKRKFSNKPIDYLKLNKLYEDFGKRFVPQ
nr:hypothetical protein [Tanacetum cinerariifolium]